MTGNDVGKDHYTAFFDVFALDRAVAEIVTASLTDSGVDGLDYTILSALRISGASTATELAAQLGVPLTTMSDWLTQRVERGLIERSRHPQDRRRLNLMLTPAGHAAYEAGRDAFGRGYLAFVERYDGDLDELRAVLEAMTRATREALTDLRDKPGVLE